MTTIFDWINQNHEWFFSGLGVFLFGGILALSRVVYSYKRNENFPDIAVHTQNIDLRARDYHENYDHALGIFIANSGDSIIHIQRALFRKRVPFLWFFKIGSNLPIYPKAFKDTEADAYELKFGAQYYDPQTEIAARDRVMTYLPLSRPAPDEKMNKRKHGEVILRYSTMGRAGTHKVYV